MCCGSSEGCCRKGSGVGLKKGHKWLLIEFCAPLDSNMHRVAKEEFPKVCVLTVTERDDGRRPETVTAIKGVIASALERGVRIFLWSSMHGGVPVSADASAETGFRLLGSFTRPVGLPQASVE